MRCDEDSDDAVMSGPEWDDSLMTIRHWDVLVAFQLLHLHSGQLHSANHRYSTQPPQPVSLFATCHLHFSQEEKTDLRKLFFQYVNFTLCHVPLSCLLLALKKARENCKYLILTRPKPSYGRQGLAGGILGPGYFSSGYILGCSLSLRFQRSARIRGSAHFLWQRDKQTSFYFIWNWWFSFPQ